MEEASILGTYGPLLMMVALFYFMLYRPQKKRQKQHQDMIDNLRLGTKVATRGGIIGVVRGLRESSVMLEVAPGVEIEVIKAMISSDVVFVNDGEEQAAE